MSVTKHAFPRPVVYRLALGVALICALSACKNDEATTTQSAAEAVTGEQAAAAAAAATEGTAAALAALSPDELRAKARAAYAESKLYAPAGDNAMEYYLALREKSPGDAAVSSALTDLMPMVVIATEQGRDREDFLEARRLSALIEKADANHPSLARLKASITGAEEAAGRRVAQQALTAEQEAARQEQLAADRVRAQADEQRAAAQQLVEQQAVAARAATEEAAAAARREEQRVAEQRAAEQRAAEERAAAARPAAATTPAVGTALRALSTPAPRYPAEALRAAQSGEVQVEFTVSPDGSVSDARVVRANPPRVFDREAVAAVRRWRFEPVAEAVTTRRTIAFNPGE
ncbi:energy transducer TonB [Luteimonas sp. MC1828]|uniref:energy transducer TonB n=1 Tax=Luteimonas sp. MC1828 TaxID=2799787 RepID=UPI0018F2243A|nr:energy transducer TonB [Luteimonas sp. MC1828]MBJ7575523.1 energy transducer TonB [Luteimonas sp. MC1828]